MHKDFLGFFFFFISEQAYILDSAELLFYYLLENTLICPIIEVQHLPSEARDTFITKGHIEARSADLGERLVHILSYYHVMFPQCSYRKTVFISLS